MVGVRVRFRTLPRTHQRPAAFTAPPRGERQRWSPHLAGLAEHQTSPSSQPPRAVQRIPPIRRPLAMGGLSNLTCIWQAGYDLNLWLGMNNRMMMYDHDDNDRRRWMIVVVLIVMDGGWWMMDDGNA